MAIVRLGHLIGAISGSLGSTNFANHRGVVIARQRARPQNQRTEKQMLRRARYIHFARSWRNLTQARRNAWQSPARQISFQNRLGQPTTLSGFAYYMRVQLELPLTELNPTTNPYRVTRARPPDAFSADFTAHSNHWITVYAFPPPYPAYFTLYISRPCSSSPRKHWPVWTYIGAMAYDPETEIQNWRTQIEASLGILRSGEVLGLALKRTAPGWISSTPLIISETVK